MKRGRQYYYLNFLIIIFSGLILISGCEMESDTELIDQSISESLDNALKEALSEMNDNPESALSSLDAIIDQSKSISSPYYIGKALWYQAFIYDNKLEDVSKAYFSYNESIKYLDLTNDAILKAKVKNNLAILNKYYEQYDVAVNIYLDVLEDQNEFNAELLCKIYFNLGRAYKLKGDQESFLKAEEAFTNALEVARGVDDHRNIARVNNQVGMMYKDLKDYDISRIAYKNTIRDYQNEDKGSSVLEYVGQAHHGIGVTFMEQQKYDEAIVSFRKALEYKKDSESIFITKYDLGTVLFETNQSAEAIKTWKDALNEKHNKNERIQVEIYSKLTSALAANNDYEDALMYAQIYNENINDILTVGEKYQAENNQVIFADIIREYDEFNQTVPFYKEPWALTLMFIFIALAVYLGSHAYYQSKLSTKVSDTRSEIQVEFQNIKLD